MTSNHDVKIDFGIPENLTILYAFGAYRGRNGTYTLWLQLANTDCGGQLSHSEATYTMVELKVLHWSVKITITLAKTSMPHILHVSLEAQGFWKTSQVEQASPKGLDQRCALFLYFVKPGMTVSWCW